MNQIAQDFVKEYLMLDEKVKKEMLTQEELVDFHEKWKFLFTHFGYYDISVVSTIGLGFCLVKRLKQDEMI